MESSVFHFLPYVELQILVSEFLQKVWVLKLAHRVNKQACRVVLQTETYIFVLKWRLGIICVTQVNTCHKTIFPKQ